MKNFSILLSALLISVNVLAQKPAEAFVISKKGDTTMGTILIPKGAKGLHYIIFKPASSSASQTLFAFNLAGFTTKEGDIYVSTDLTYDIGPFIQRTNNESNPESYGHMVNPDNLKQMQYKDTGIYVTRTLFAKVLVFGKASLYYFKDSTDRSHFFIAKNNSHPVELTFRRFMKKVMGGPVQSSVANRVTTHNGDADGTLNNAAFALQEVEDNTFRDQLLKSMNDCPNMHLDDFTAVQYYEEELVPLVRKYDLCQGKLFYIEKY